MRLLHPHVYLLALAAAFASAALAQSFDPGNLVVLRLGDGSQTLVSSGNTVFLDQYTTNGGLINSVTIPDSGANALIVSGTAGSEGGLTRSADRTMLTFAGYCTNRGSVSGSLSSQTAASVPRGVAAVDAFGNYSLVEASTSLYSTNNIRCAATDGTNHFWTAGVPNGTYYLNPPASPVNVQTNAGGNTLYVKIINGNLCFSTQKGTVGLYTFSGGGLPKTPAATNLLFATGSSSSPEGFDLNPSQILAYVADTRGSAGGIQKWTNNGTAWSLAYTLSTGAGAFAVAVDFSGPVPVIYATTGESAANRLVCVVDTNSTATATLLATAGANQWFRGLDFAPDLRPFILTQPQSQVVTNGSDVSFSVTAASPYALGYQWQMDGTNLSGQTTATLTLTNVSSTDQGTYQVVVTNQYNSVTSTPAILTVNTEIIPPSITSGPQSQTNVLGGTATFTVTATGTALNYQWEFNSSDLSGQSSTSLTLNNLSAASQGSYQVRVFNSAGSTTSPPATLTVLIPPASFIPYTSPALVYSQNFDSLPDPGTQTVNSDNPVTINGVTYGVANPFDFTYPIIPNGVGPVSGVGLGGLGLSNSMPGWYGLADIAPKFGASEGDQSTGGIISFGSTNGPGASNRALGLLATSSTGGTAFGAKLINQTTNTLTRLTLQFTGELWRQSAVPKTLEFSYYVDPTATNGFPSNVTASLTNLNVSFPTDPSAATPVPVDGTALTNQVVLAVTNQTIADWPPGAALWLVWQMADPTGKGQGIAIDDLTFSASLWSTGLSSPPLSALASGTNFLLSCPTITGLRYQFQYKTNLDAASWLPLGAPIPGTGGPITVTNSLTDCAQCFYRLTIQP
jgi:hypothetical protein